MDNDPLANTDVDDINDFLSGGVPGAGFDAIGDKWVGIVVDFEKVQQTDYDTGVPVTWDDGTPKMMLHVDIQTDVRDEEIVGDDGVRRLYVRGNMLTKFKSALRAAKMRMDRGVEVTVAYIADGDPPKKGMNPPKLYDVVVAPGPTGVSADDLV
jgi:hypothetical protein